MIDLVQNTNLLTKILNVYQLCFKILLICYCLLLLLLLLLMNVLSDGYHLCLKVLLHDCLYVSSSVVTTFLCQRPP